MESSDTLGPTFLFASNLPELSSCPHLLDGVCVLQSPRLTEHMRYPCSQSTEVNYVTYLAVRAFEIGF